MELADLIAALSEPSAYPHDVDAVEVHQTHISVVFLAGAFAYKVKKPVKLAFVDYSTPELRRHYCELETNLNRRLAPRVYLGVVPIARVGARVQIGGAGPVLEWAVKMTRLPAGATLAAWLEHDLLDSAVVEAVARRIVAFHARAEGGAAISAAGTFPVVAGNARDNFAQSAEHVGVTVSRPVFERARLVTDRALETLRPLIDARAARGVPRDGHGDLRLDHVYVFPDRPPPDDLVIVDAIEFNAAFRHADPVADMAFLDMDLVLHGRPDLAGAFADAYFAVSGDAEGRALLPFYRSYRAAVRGKVQGIRSLAPEIAETERAGARERARARWLLALGALEEPDRRPCVVLVAGLPGTGKSTLAKGLASRAGLSVIRTDVVRKELAAQTGVAPAAADFEQGIYTPEWTERTYAECLRRAEALVFQGARVLIDASFGREASRRQFLDAARGWGVPGVLLVCRVEPSVALARIAQRRGDASDADRAVYEQAANRWELLGPTTQRVAREVPSGGSAEQTLNAALAVLREFGCAGPD